MAEQVGVRELKARLSHYLKRVSKGDVLLVTDRGRPVAEIRSAPREPPSRLEALVLAGQVVWSGRKMDAIQPFATTLPGRSVADAILKDRE